MQEFNLDCKRRRPNFSPDEELESELELNCPDAQPTNRGSSKQQIVFFSLFTKSHRKLNHEKMFRQPKSNPKPKLSTKRKIKKKDNSLIKSRGDQDIRKLLGRSANVITRDNLQIQVLSNYREGESGVKNRVPALKGGGENGKLSTSPVQFSQSSDQVVKATKDL